MMAQRAVTDRAHRYRANQLAPVDGKVCLFCGSTQFLVPDHWDGHPDHTHEENLETLCKSCNTAKGAAFRKAGRGRLTHQYNPTKGGGAATVGEWMQAVGSITPHIDRGDRGLVSTMSVRDAVDMIRATPQSKRRDFAARMRRRSNPWPFSRPDARRTTPASGGIAYHTSKRRPATAKTAASSRASAKKAAGPGAFSLPDERTIQEGFRRGLSLREILAQNPVLRAFQKSNPSKFDRCVKAVQAKGGAANAYAVCTAAGTRNPGRDEALAESSAYGAGQAYAEISNRNRTTPDRTSFLSFVRSWAKKHGETAKAAEGPISDGFRATFTDWRKRNAATCRTCKGLSDHTKGSLKYVCPDCGRVCNLQRNPATASAEAFEEFHGFAPSEVITVTKKLHYHKHLAAAGELIQLDVWGIDEQGHRISGFKGAYLAFNETKNQLFVEGGDQAVNLEDFGITEPHELETLGRLTDIGYHTKKTHLGSEGGEAVYVHKFRTTNDGGKHVVVKIARYPDLIYDVRNEQLLFSGGSYEILREGIDK